MEVMDIIRAYEILRSHGCGLQLVFSQDRGISKEVLECDSKLENERNFLVGNTNKQLPFLGQLLTEKEKNL